jgi:hypothetical protein
MIIDCCQFIINTVDTLPMILTIKRRVQFLRVPELLRLVLTTSLFGEFRLICKNRIQKIPDESLEKGRNRSCRSPNSPKLLYCVQAT